MPTFRFKIFYFLVSLSQFSCVAPGGIKTGEPCNFRGVCGLGLICVNEVCQPNEEVEAGEVVNAGETITGDVIGGEVTAGEVIAGETIMGRLMAGEFAAGEMTAGEVTAGEMAVGEAKAGEVTADEMIAGEPTAGEVMAGEVTAGEMIAGEAIAGEVTAGEPTAGEVTAGEMMAGEMIAGEMIAGEVTAGEIIRNECGDGLVNGDETCDFEDEVTGYWCNRDCNAIAPACATPEYVCPTAWVKYTGMAITSNGMQRVIDPFWIQKNEITFADYQHCVTSGICSPISTYGSCNNVYEIIEDSKPVVCLEETQLSNYSAWVGASLPMKSQWLFASKNENTTNYPWGNNVNTCNYANLGCMGFGTISPVCTHTDGNNHRAVCDLIGNAAEIVIDDMSSDYVLIGGSVYGPFFSGSQPASLYPPEPYIGSRLTAVVEEP